MKIVLLLIGFVLAISHLAEAQPTKKMPRIGFLVAGPASAVSGRVNAFRQGLRDIGYSEGGNIIVEYRYGDGKVERRGCSESSQPNEIHEAEMKKMKSHGKKEVRARKTAADRYLEKVDWFANGAGFDMIPRDFVTDFCCGVSLVKGVGGCSNACRRPGLSARKL